MDTQDDYQDIINIPHHVSTKHPQMSMASRAAQFAAFTALNGYDDAIQNTAENHHAEDNYISDDSPS